jgi:hypothetical protein
MKRCQIAIVGQTVSLPENGIVIEDNSGWQTNSLLHDSSGWQTNSLLHDSNGWQTNTLPHVKGYSPELEDGTGTPGAPRRFVEQQFNELPRGLSQQQQRCAVGASSRRPRSGGGNRRSVRGGVQTRSRDGGDTVRT